MCHLLINNVSLAAVAVHKNQYPADKLPEIAFAGRSNAGKSSLINALVNRKALARSSQTPGKTRTINFYNVENAMYFVDLPGYGYAKLSKSESEKWGDMIEKYLIKNERLRAVVLILDIRRAVTENDSIMYEFLRHYNIKVIVAATKADKISRAETQRQLASICAALNVPAGGPVLFSSETKLGKDELWRRIEDAAGLGAENQT